MREQRTDSVFTAYSLMFNATRTLDMHPSRPEQLTVWFIALFDSVKRNLVVHASDVFQGPRQHRIVIGEIQIQLREFPKSGIAYVVLPFCMFHRSARGRRFDGHFHFLASAPNTFHFIGGLQFVRNEMMNIIPAHHSGDALPLIRDLALHRENLGDSVDCFTRHANEQFPQRRDDARAIRGIGFEPLFGKRFMVAKCVTAAIRMKKPGQCLIFSMHKTFISHIKQFKL